MYEFASSSATLLTVGLYTAVMHARRMNVIPEAGSWNYDTCYLWPYSSVILRRSCNLLCTSGFIDDVMFAHYRPEKGDAKMEYSK